MSSSDHYDDTDKATVIRAETLAVRHWAFINDLLTIHDVPTDRVCEIEFHYVAAFIHGYKHGFIDAKKGNRMSKKRKIRLLHKSIDRLAMEVGIMEELLDRICMYYVREQSDSLKGAIEEAKILIARKPERARGG